MNRKAWLLFFATVSITALWFVTDAWIFAAGLTLLISAIGVFIWEATSPAPRRWFLYLVAMAFLVAILLSMGFLGHALASGVVLPYPDPTPEQAVYERYHVGISNCLFTAAAIGWLLTGITALFGACTRWARQGKR